MPNDESGPHILDLLPSGVIYSKPFEWRGHQVKFRLLDGGETVQCRLAATKLVVDDLVEKVGLERKDAFELAQAGSSRDNERAWFHAYVLAATMCSASNGAPLGAGDHADVAYRLHDEMPPIEREAYIMDYLEFADEHDPSSYTDDEIEEIIATAGKSPDGSTWKRYGSSALRSFLTTLVPRLIRAEMALERFQEAEPLEARVKELERRLELATLPTPKSSDGSGSQSS